MEPDFQTYNLTNFKLTPAECGEVFAAGRADCGGGRKLACRSQRRLSAGSAVGGTTLRVCFFRVHSCGSWTTPLFPSP